MSYKSKYHFGVVDNKACRAMLDSLRKRLERYLDAAYRGGYDFLDVELTATFVRKSELQEAKP